MNRMTKVELTNMCMIYDRNNNKVLVQNRKSKTWSGITFPGGHIENGESIVDSVIREIKEETGLTISNLESCGIIDWYNNKTNERYLVFNYRTECFTGELLESTSEGEVFWVDKNQLYNLELSEGLEERIPMFFENKYLEGFTVFNDNYDSGIKFL